MRPTSTERAVFVLALLVSVTLCLGAMWCIPSSNGADEPGHLDYAGYVFEHGSLPDTKTLRHPQATQQPFLYYAWVAGFRAVFSGPAAAERPPAELPYERRVAIGRAPIPDPMKSQRVAPGAAPPMVSAAAPYVWRLSGLPLLVIVVVCVFRTAWRVFPAASAAATLAAALAVLVPTLPVAFSAITNDQFAILFGSLGFAPVAIGAAQGRIGPRRALLAGVLFALGFLSKSTMAGAFTAAVVLLWFHAPRPVRERLRDLALLAAPPLLGAAWWYVSRIRETGHTDFVMAVGAQHPQLLRAVEPDWLGYLDTLAGTVLSWTGLVGPAISPGNLFLVFGAALSVMTVLGAAGVACSRTASRLDRAIAGAFLAGAALLVGLLLLGTRYSYLIHGRHLLNLVVPGALACVVAARHLFGRRARQALAAFVTWFGLMGLALLHGAIIPLFHPPRDRLGSPDLVAYLDAGALSAAPFVERGAARPEPTWAPRPEGTVVADPEEVRLRVPGLDPAGAYVAWIRVHPLTRAIEAEDFFADELPLGGLVTPIGTREWLPFAIPREATADGTVSISARAVVGTAAIAELLVTRRPLAVRTPAAFASDAVRVTLESPAPERLPPLQAHVIAREAGGSSKPQDVAFAGGRCELVIPLAAGMTGPLDLALVPPPTVWSDTKVAPLAVAPAEHVVHPDSPGYDCVRIPEGTPPGTPVLRLLGMNLPPGRYVTEVLDERSRPIPKGVLAFALPSGQLDAAGATFEVASSEDAALKCDVLWTGGARPLVDRLRILRAQPIVYDLGVAR